MVKEQPPLAPICEEGGDEGAPSLAALVVVEEDGPAGFEIVPEPPTLHAVASPVLPIHRHKPLQPVLSPPLPPPPLNESVAILEDIAAAPCVVLEEAAVSPPPSEASLRALNNWQDVSAAAYLRWLAPPQYYEAPPAAPLPPPSPKQQLYPGEDWFGYAPPPPPPPLPLPPPPPPVPWFGMSWTDAGWGGYNTASPVHAPREISRILPRRARKRPAESAEPRWNTTGVVRPRELRIPGLARRLKRLRVALLGRSGQNREASGERYLSPENQAVGVGGGGAAAASSGISHAAASYTHAAVTGGARSVLQPATRTFSRAVGLWDGGELEAPVAAPWPLDHIHQSPRVGGRNSSPQPHLHAAAPYERSTSPPRRAERQAVDATVAREQNAADGEGAGYLHAPQRRGADRVSEQVGAAVTPFLAQGSSAGLGPLTLRRMRTLPSLAGHSDSVRLVPALGPLNVSQSTRNLRRSDLPSLAALEESRGGGDLRDAPPPRAVRALSPLRSSSVPLPRHPPGGSGIIASARAEQQQQPVVASTASAGRGLAVVRRLRSLQGGATPASASTTGWPSLESGGWGMSLHATPSLLPLPQQPSLSDPELGISPTSPLGRRAFLVQDVPKPALSSPGRVTAPFMAGFVNRPLQPPHIIFPDRDGPRGRLNTLQEEEDGADAEVVADDGRGQERPARGASVLRGRLLSGGGSFEADDGEAEIDRRDAPASSSAYFAVRRHLQASHYPTEQSAVAPASGPVPGVPSLRALILQHVATSLRQSDPAAVARHVEPEQGLQDPLGATRLFVRRDESRQSLGHEDDDEIDAVLSALNG